jgi:hypothetical protein
MPENDNDNNRILLDMINRLGIIEGQVGKFNENTERFWSRDWQAMITRVTFMETSVRDIVARIAELALLDDLKKRIDGHDRRISELEKSMAKFSVYAAIAAALGSTIAVTIVQVLISTLKG